MFGVNSNVRNSMKPVSGRSQLNEESQTPENRRENGSQNANIHKNIMPSNPEIYQSYQVASAGAGLGKPSNNIMDSNLDQSNRNFQS